MIDKNVNLKLMTLKEVAEYLRVTEKTIHRLLEKNAIPAARVGHLWRFDNDSINKWLQERSIFVKTRILVIDDEEPINALIKETLGKLGYEVVTAESVVDGLKLAEEQDFNLVFLDLRILSIDGTEAFKQIKSVKPDIPIVIITGYSDSDLLMQALSYRPLGVIIKPFSDSDILQVLNNYVRISR